MLRVCPGNGIYLAEEQARGSGFDNSLAVSVIIDLLIGEVSEWLKVPLSKSGVAGDCHRGFESLPLRHFDISSMKYFLQNEPVKFGVMNGGLLLPVVVVAFYDRLLAAELALLVGVVWLAVLLVVPRMRKMRYFERWDDSLLAVAKQSKWLGLWTGGWFWFYGVLRLVSTDGVGWGYVPLLLSLGIFAVLAGLSNKWSYAHVRWWKQINMLVWMVPVLLMGYVWTVAGDFTSGVVLLAVLAGGMIMTGFGLTGVFVRQPDYFARWRLGYLLVAAVLSVGCTVLAN